MSPAYDRRHRGLRKRLAPTVDAGRVTCWRCNRLILPGEAWDLGHTENGRGWKGPEHQHCNRSAGGRKGRAAQTARPAPTPPNGIWSRHWCGGVFDPRCGDCRERGSACDEAISQAEMLTTLAERQAA